MSYVLCVTTFPWPPSGQKSQLNSSIVLLEVKNSTGYLYGRIGTKVERNQLWLLVGNRTHTVFSCVKIKRGSNNNDTLLSPLFLNEAIVKMCMTTRGPCWINVNTDCIRQLTSKSISSWGQSQLWHSQHCKKKKTISSKNNVPVTLDDPQTSLWSLSTGSLCQGNTPQEKCWQQSLSGLWTSSLKEIAAVQLFKHIFSMLWAWLDTTRCKWENVVFFIIWLKWPSKPECSIHIPYQ